MGDILTQVLRPFYRVNRGLDANRKIRQRGIVDETKPRSAMPLVVTEAEQPPRERIDADHRPAREYIDVFPDLFPCSLFFGLRQRLHHFDGGPGADQCRPRDHFGRLGKGNGVDAGAEADPQPVPPDYQESTARQVKRLRPADRQRGSAIPAVPEADRGLHAGAGVELPRRPLADLVAAIGFDYQVAVAQPLPRP